MPDQPKTRRLKFLDADGKEVAVWAGVSSVVSWSVAGDWVTCEYRHGGKQAHRIPPNVVSIVQTRETPAPEGTPK